MVKTVSVADLSDDVPKSPAKVTDVPLDQFLKERDRVKELERKAKAYDTLLDKAIKNFGGFPAEALLCCRDPYIKVETQDDFTYDFLDKSISYKITVGSTVKESDMIRMFGEDFQHRDDRWAKLFEDKPSKE